MKNLFLSLAVCLMALCTMAEDINAVKFVQDETTDWYLLNTQPEVDGEPGKIIYV